MQFVPHRVKLLNILARYRQITDQRSLTLAKHQLKWVTGKEALGPEIPIGSVHGHPDDPERNSRTKYYTHIEGKDEPIPEYTYRDTVNHRNYLDRFMHKLCSSIFWSWFLYNAYWNYGMILGHYYLPYLSEFNNQELGILPDDANDPVYWGHHGQPDHTYR